MIIVEGLIQDFGNNHFMGFIPKFKGLVVQGASVDEIKNELLNSLRVKIAFDYDLDISKVGAKELKSIKDLKVSKGKTANEFKFEYAL
ncbi:MAG: hypothetical protein WD512_00115 [Candidatus Paceibacterota bacterium]